MNKKACNFLALSNAIFSGFLDICLPNVDVGIIKMWNNELMAGCIESSNWGHGCVGGILVEDAGSLGVEEKDLSGLSWGNEESLLGRNDHVSTIVL